MDIFIAIVITFFMGLIAISSLTNTVKAIRISNLIAAIISFAVSVITFVASVYPWMHWV